VTRSLSRAQQHRHHHAGQQQPGWCAGPGRASSRVSATPPSAPTKAAITSPTVRAHPAPAVARLIVQPAGAGGARQHQHHRQARAGGRAQQDRGRPAGCGTAPAPAPRPGPAARRPASAPSVRGARISPRISPACSPCQVRAQEAVGEKPARPVPPAPPPDPAVKPRTSQRQQATASRRGLADSLGQPFRSLRRRNGWNGRNCSREFHHRPAPGAAPGALMLIRQSTRMPAASPRRAGADQELVGLASAKPQQPPLLQRRQLRPAGALAASPRPRSLRPDPSRTSGPGAHHELRVQLRETDPAPPARCWPGPAACRVSPMKELRPPRRARRRSRSTPLRRAGVRAPARCGRQQLAAMADHTGAALLAGCPAVRASRTERCGWVSAWLLRSSAAPPSRPERIQPVERAAPRWKPAPPPGLQRHDGSRSARRPARPAAAASRTDGRPVGVPVHAHQARAAAQARRHDSVSEGSIADDAGWRGEAMRHAQVRRWPGRRSRQVQRGAIQQTSQASSQSTGHPGRNRLMRRCLSPSGQ
jgi:hypothetical protein